MWYQNGKKLMELHVCTIYLAYKKWKKEKSMKFERNYIYNLFSKSILSDDCDFNSDIK